MIRCGSLPVDHYASGGGARTVAQAPRSDGAASHHYGGDCRASGCLGLSDPHLPQHWGESPTSTTRRVGGRTVWKRD